MNTADSEGKSNAGQRKPNAMPRRRALADGRKLLKWLSDEKMRIELYERLLREKLVLEFRSRAEKTICAGKKYDCDECAPGTSSVFAQDAYIVANRDDVVYALTNPKEFTNDPYNALGTGTFMLGLDPSDADYERQRDFAIAYLASIDKSEIYALCTAAFMAGAVLPLKQRDFDLVELSGQVALRYVSFMFGFAHADQLLLEEAAAAGYLGLNYQILGRHFATEPQIMPDATVKMGALLERVTHLIDLYLAPIGVDEERELENIDKELAELKAFKNQKCDQPLKNFVPILRRIARCRHKRKGSGSVANKNNPGPYRGYTGTELAVIVCGLIVGTVGNIQASVCIAIKHLLRSDCGSKWRAGQNADCSPKEDKPCDDAKENECKEEKKCKCEDPADVAAKAWVASHDAACDPALQALIWEALRLEPPVAFLPRKTISEVTLPASKRKLEKCKVVVLAMGAATCDGGAGFEFRCPNPGSAGDTAADNTNDQCEAAMPDPLIFGGPPARSGFLHQCIGQHIATPIVTHLVRQILLLPSLAESLDPVTGKIIGLVKLWGFNCQKYPLEFNRSAIQVQYPLNVIMNVKMPLSVHAEALKLLIKYGAPDIEKKLGDAKHVHFAQFMFIENDTKLALFTTYDRDFDAYIEYFALQVGPFFDLLFEHLEDTSPSPVHAFPKEFVDCIRRHNVPPEGNYFFSAYPLATTALIVNDCTRTCK